MNYNDTIAAVQTGKYGWRTSWASGVYIYDVGGTIEKFGPGSPSGTPYMPAPSQDVQATNWAIGDRPPK